MMRLYETTEFMRMTWEDNRFANIRIYHSADFPGNSSAKAAGTTGLVKKTLKALPTLWKWHKSASGKTVLHY
jgi:hypothetical protein